MPATLPPPGAPDVLYLVDLSGYVFRAYHAIAPLSSSKGEPTHAVMGTVSMLQKVVADRKPHSLAVAMDSKGPTFRHELDARYKANRPPPPPDLSQQMMRCEQIVRAYNIPVFQKNGLEADDFIAAVTARALADGLSVVIVSADKDLMQLVHDGDTRVVLWDSMRDRVFGPDEVKEKFGVLPSKVRDFLALTGDTSDNVPGVPSVGPKTASDLLNQYGSLEGVYAHVDEIKRAKLREALKEHETDARLSQKLVTLAGDAPIEWNKAQLVYGGADVPTLRALFEELELTRMLAVLDALGSGGSPVAISTSGAAPAASAVPVVAVEAKRSAVLVLEEDELRKLVAEAKTKGVVALDTETTSTDPMRAVMVGMSLATKAGEGFYIPVGHRYLGAPKQLSIDVVRGIVGPLLADASVKKVAHHLKYDEIILRRNGMPIGGDVFDTMIASYLLDPETTNGLKDVARRELGVTMTTYDQVTSKQRGSQLAFDEVPLDRATDYAAADADLSFALYERYAPRVDEEGLGKLLRDVEIPLSRVLCEMEMHGVLVDVPLLEVLSKQVAEDLVRLEAKAKEIAGRDFSVRSRDQLETILFDELKLPVVKKTPKGGRSTDAEVLEALADKHALPKQILEFRELDKLKGTYLDALPTFVNPTTGRIHTSFNQVTAATGRLASLDPNLQNIPIRSEIGKKIRGAFIAPPGQVIVSADYSQIELRVLAHLSQDPELLDAFRNGEDVHARTARLIFDKGNDAVTSDERRAAKTINFGVIYGMGDSALAKQIGVSRDEAARFIEAYFTRYAGVRTFMERTVEAARQGEAVRTILGRRRFLPNLHSSNRALRFEAERVAKNTPIQGTAADILKLAMLALGRAPVVEGAYMILTVHDELVFEIPEAKTKEAEGLIREAMSGAMKLDVPLVVDVGHGKSWAEAH
jgi:DNA polymerase-1